LGKIRAGVLAAGAFLVEGIFALWLQLRMMEAFGLGASDSLSSTEVGLTFIALVLSVGFATWLAGRLYSDLRLGRRVLFAIALILAITVFLGVALLALIVLIGLTEWAGLGLDDPPTGPRVGLVVLEMAASVVAGGALGIWSYRSLRP